MNARPRFYAYVVITIFLVIIVGWVGSHTWQELRQLHRSFASAEGDDFYVSDHIERSVYNLNEIALKFDLHTNLSDMSTFQTTGQGLQKWIHERQNSLSTKEQCELAAQEFTAVQDYLSATTRLMEERAQKEITASKASLLEQLDANSASILDLSRRLKASERTEQTQFIKDSQRALAWIQQLLLIVLLALVAMVGSMRVAIYRGVIGPLRSEVTESRAIAARHEKLASLGTLAAGVAHEIRNPLTAINVRLHSLKKNLLPGSSEQEDALVIGHEIQRLEHLLKEFLQFARPSEPKFVTVSVDSLLAKAQVLLGSQLERNSIRLEVESVPDIWVMADPHQIEQVLINLIQNSAESIEKGGVITLRTRTGKARLGKTVQPVVMLEVNDTGKGIPPEVRGRIFDPFFTTKEEGTGLGLAIALRIIEKHGGTLECHSELNHGTTISIVLPTAKLDTNNELST